MNIRTSLIALALLTSSIFGIQIARAAAPTLTAADKTEINSDFKIISYSIPHGDYGAIQDLLADDASDEVYNGIFNGTPFESDVQSFSLTNVHQTPGPEDSATLVTYTGTIAIDTDTYTGTSTAYFVFEQQDSKNAADSSWYLYDTDFYKYLGSTDASSSDDSDTATSTAGTTHHMDPTLTGGILGLGLAAFAVIAIVAVLGILFTIFWIWMLIEILRSSNKNKILWFVFVFIIGPIAAAIYYFVEYRPHHAKVAAPQPAPTSTATPEPPAPPVS